MWSWRSPFMSACDPLIQAERRFKARCLNRSRWDLFPCRGPVVPCRTLWPVSATCNGTVKPALSPRDEWLCLRTSRAFGQFYFSVASWFIGVAAPSFKPGLQAARYTGPTALW